MSKVTYDPMNPNWENGKGFFGNLADIIDMAAKNQASGGEYYKQLQQQDALKQYANVLSGNNVPQGVKDQWSPAQIQAGQLQALANLGPRAGMGTNPIEALTNYNTLQQQRQQMAMNQTLMQQLGGALGGQQGAPAPQSQTAPQPSVAPGMPGAPAAGPDMNDPANAPLNGQMNPMPGSIPMQAPTPAAPSPAMPGVPQSGGLNIPDNTLALLNVVNPKLGEAMSRVKQEYDKNHPFNRAREEALGKAAGTAASTAQDIVGTTSNINNILDQLEQTVKQAPSGPLAPVKAWTSRFDPNSKTASAYDQVNQLTGLLKALDIKPLFQGTGQVRKAELDFINQIEGIAPTKGRQSNLDMINNLRHITNNQAALASQKNKIALNPNAQPEAPKLEPFTNQQQRVRVISPDGKPGTIDASHVEDLKREGGKVVQ